MGSGDRRAEDAAGEEAKNDDNGEENNALLIDEIGPLDSAGEDLNLLDCGSDNAPLSLLAFLLRPPPGSPPAK